MERDCLPSSVGCLLGVTLPSQASKVVKCGQKAVSELLLASGSALAVCAHSRTHESETFSLACTRYAQMLRCG
jgi:hypothetical protein